MTRRGVVGQAIRDGVRAGIGEAWKTYRMQVALEGFRAGFDEAFAISDAVPGWFDRVPAACFWSVVHEQRPRTVVEIGSYLGRSTVLIAEALRHAGIPDSQLHAIDPHTGDRQHLDALGLTNLPTLDLFRVFLRASGNHEAVQTHVARSSDVLADFHQDLDLVFVDGWHEYDAVLSDVRGFGRLLSESGLMCIDDVRNYDEVDRASRVGLAAAGLTHYGAVAGQAWAGRSAVPPPCLRSVLRLERRFQRAVSRLDN